MNLANNNNLVRLLVLMSFLFVAMGLQWLLGAHLSSYRWLLFLLSALIFVFIIFLCFKREKQLQKAYLRIDELLKESKEANEKISCLFEKYRNPDGFKSFELSLGSHDFSEPLTLNQDRIDGVIPKNKGMRSKEDLPLILVVEDNPEMNYFISRSLSADFRVESAFDGNEGLGKAISLIPDLIISDYMMPGMNGDQMVAQIRNHPNLADIPVIILTVKNDDEVRLKLLRDKVHDYLVKPFTLSDLISRAANLAFQHQKQKRKLEESEERFQILIEQAPDAFFVHNLKGNIINVNKNACESLGYSREELLNMNVMDVEQDIDLEIFTEALKTFNVGQHIMLSGHHKRKDGSVFPVEASVSVFEIEGERLFLDLVRDISERARVQEKLKQSEQKLKRQNEEYIILNEELTESNKRIQRINKELNIAKEKAEESDRLKSSFLANMSHEIRTPMNAIVGFSNMISQCDLPEEKVKKFTKLIQERSYDLLHIIDDILDVSKLEVGQMKVSFSSSSLSVVLNDLFEYYKVKIQESEDKSDISLKLTLPEELGEVIIYTDILRLKQIINNLIDNSIKFTNEGWIEFGCNSVEPHELIFFVRDSGIGIPKEKQESIFDHFRQADESLTTRQYGGSGLGLSIVKGLINLLNGKIWLESELGKGATFYFSLPCNSSKIKDANPQKIETTHSSWNNKTILIVEDDEANSVYLEEVLDARDVKVLKAFNGAEALDIMHKVKTIDLILMDIRLPDINGLKLTQMIKSQNSQMIIIAQTAYTSSADIQKCLDAGCNDYIAKPINSVEILSMIDEYFEKE